MINPTTIYHYHYAYATVTINLITRNIDLNLNYELIVYIYDNITSMLTHIGIYTSEDDAAEGTLAP